MSQGKAAEQGLWQGDSRHIPHLQDRHGAQPDWGYRVGEQIAGLLGKYQVSKQISQLYKSLLEVWGGGETAGEKDISVVPFAIPTVWSHPPSQRGPVIL